MTSTILITGIAGFVGTHLVDSLLANSTTSIAGLVHPSHENRHLAANPRIALHTTDILDDDKVAAFIEQLRPDAIYHLAGFANVSESWKSRKEVIETNFLGSFYLLEACRRLARFPRVLLVGSAECYGIVEPDRQPIREDHPLSPSSPYSVSKISQEMLGLQYARSEDLPVYLSRSFNHTGPRQKESFVCSAFARQIARAEAGLQEPVIRVGNLSSRRDFTDVRDVVLAYQAILAKGKPGSPYNVCSGRAVSIEQMLELMLSFARKKFEVVVDPDKFRPSDMPLLLGSADRLRADTGWTPAWSLEQTLKDLLDYWRDRVSNGQS